MGMNYYLRTKRGETCPHCGHQTEDELLHIGKSSGGWCFSLHVIPEEGIHDLEDWIPRLTTGTIVDEGGCELTSEELLDIIRNRASHINWDNVWQQGRMPYSDEAEFHARNYSERGPNNLLRHRVDGLYVIKHGDGTWDCLPGEFS